MRSKVNKIPTKVRLATALRISRVISHICSARTLKKKLSGQEPPIADDWEYSRNWQQQLIEILGTEVVVRGEVPKGGALLAINHVSWIDPVVIGTLMPIRFVAKAQSEHWPVIGGLLSAIGTVYIVRGGHQTQHVVEKMASTMKAGVAVGFFPEATTTHGRRISYMFPRLFKAALDHQIPIVPVSIRYSKSARGKDSAPYIDDMNFLSHLFTILRHPPMRVELMFLPAVTGIGRDDIANQVRNSISRSLELPEALCQKRTADIDFKQLWYELRYRSADSV